jgi:hypothetical protein
MYAAKQIPRMAPIPGVANADGSNDDSDRPWAPPCERMPMLISSSTSDSATSSTPSSHAPTWMPNQHTAVTSTMPPTARIGHGTSTPVRSATACRVCAASRP